MQTKQALEIISILSDGKDPETGEPLAQQSCFNQPQVIRALFVAKESLEKAIKAEKRRSELPENSGKPWSAQEDEKLSSLFDAGEPLEQIAQAFGRTRGSIASRLVRIGKVSERSNLYIREADISNA